MDIPEPEKNWCLAHGPRSACLMSTSGVCRPVIVNAPSTPRASDPGAAAPNDQPVTIEDADDPMAEHRGATPEQLAAAGHTDEIPCPGCSAVVERFLDSQTETPDAI